MVRERQKRRRRGRKGDGNMEEMEGMERGTGKEKAGAGKGKSRKQKETMMKIRERKKLITFVKNIFLRNTPERHPSKASVSQKLPIFDCTAACTPDYTLHSPYFVGTFQKHMVPPSTHG